MIKPNTEMIAMILAGGQGSRLKEITENIAKPAVTFGGKYRIIDFALSNCTNSSIDVVGILTQYQPLVLNNHIGIGSSWDLDGGLAILPPYVGKDGGRFYKGTANAIYENIHFIDGYEPEYVLILSGDHIYNMDYAKMLKFHKKKNAELTIGVLEVTWEETHRFGIMNIDEENKIIEFEEKPKKAKSNLASMGIYIFNWKRLKKELIEDEKNTKSNNDFGKNIIPGLVKKGEAVYAYQFDGYWKDVGTVESLWEANMDLITKKDVIDLNNPNWKNYSVNPNSPPQYISPTGLVVSSLLNEGCIIEGQVHSSVISPDVKIEAGARVEESILMNGVLVEEGADVYRAIVLDKVVIAKGSLVGNRDSGEIIVYTGRPDESKMK